MTIRDLVYETISAVQHQIWADWMEYLFSICMRNQDGSVTIPAVLARRWQQQILTPYTALSEQSKDSDREQTEKLIKALHTDVGEVLRNDDPIPESPPLEYAASEPDDTTDFERELASVINRHSKERGSDTPDFVLAGFLHNILEVYNDAVADRDRWHGDITPRLS